VIDHLPDLDAPMESQALSIFQVNLRELGQRPPVYVKLSALLQRVDGRVPQDLNFYRAKLDGLWSIFGEKRLLYGSDWPNRDLWARYEQLLNIFLHYFTVNGATIAEKFFWRNSVASYNWVKREATESAPIVPD
jgi:L-fuconolactonase